MSRPCSTPSPGEPPPVLGVAQACGKLILLGEHFVVHGAPALALPLPALTTEVTVDCPGREASVQLCTELSGAHADLAQRMLTTALARLGLSARQGWRVTVRSTLPPGVGLGSSAAFAVAACRALARATGEELTPPALEQHAHALERLAHGQPSGIDTAVVAAGRPLWYQRGCPPRFLPEASLSLVLASSGAPGLTHEAVGRVRALRAVDPARFARGVAQAGELVQEGLAAWLEHDAVRLGAALDANHLLLEQLGVTTPAIQRLVAVARQHGALGAKLTGAGLGGCMVALAQPGHAPELVQELARGGATLVVAVTRSD